MEQVFFVQPYVLRARGIVGRAAQPCRSAESARRTGARLARRFEGIVVGVQDYDARSGRVGRPVVLAVHGTVPDDWTQAPRAA
jgi:hypothetical protein